MSRADLSLVADAAGIAAPPRHAGRHVLSLQLHYGGSGWDENVEGRSKANLTTEFYCETGLQVHLRSVMQGQWEVMIQYHKRSSPG